MPVLGTLETVTLAAILNVSETPADVDVASAVELPAMSRAKIAARTAPTRFFALVEYKAFSLRCDGEWGRPRGVSSAAGPAHFTGDRPFAPPFLLMSRQQ